MAFDRGEELLGNIDDSLDVLAKTPPTYHGEIGGHFFDEANLCLYQ